MNPILKGLDEIKYRIPSEVLARAFKDEISGWRNPQTSLDERIMSLVIRPRVLVDCNLVGGSMTNVPLNGLPLEIIDNSSIIMSIPKDRTQGRSILTPLSVSYLPMMGVFSSQGDSYGEGMISPFGMTDIGVTGQRIGQASSGPPPVSTSAVSLIGENTILVREQWRVTSLYNLRCILCNEENLNNISPRSYLVFARLFELAVKSYIYNQLIVKLGKAYLQGGQELGEIKSVIESYSDAEEMYQTFLREKVQAVSKMNDIPAFTRLIKLQLSPGV